MATRGKPGQRIEVAADAETAIAGEIPVTIEDGQARQFDRQPRAVAIGRPVQGDAAPGVAGGGGGRNAILRIERKRRVDLRPWPAEGGRRPRADQAGELAGAQQERAVGIHLPGEAERPFEGADRHGRFLRGAGMAGGA